MKTFHVKMVEAVDHCTRKTAMYATVVKVSQEIIVIQKVKKITTFLITREFYQELQKTFRHYCTIAIAVLDSFVFQRDHS